MNSNVVIINPLWKDQQYIGKARIDRFLRWLNQAGFFVTIVCAGNNDRIEYKEYRTEIVIKDYAGIFGEKKGNNTVRKRRPNKFRKLIFKNILLPDYGIIWAWQVYFNKHVRNSIKKTTFIISSSPPESPHVVAYRLAKKFNKKLIIDMRDGWLDDPLRSELINNKFRNFRERLIEKRILTYANKIFVTSDVWKTELARRYGTLNDKIIVITNTYPNDHESFAQQIKESDEKLVFLYLGRLTASRKSQKIEYILNPLLNYSEEYNEKFEIRFVGHLVEDDFIGLNKSIKKFSQSNSKVIVKNEIPKSQITDVLKEASGLLLLCISKAAVPSKLYEYIPTLKPILVITYENSAVWNIVSTLPQAYLIDPANSEIHNEVIKRFIDHSKGKEGKYNIPKIYSEEYVSNIFVNEFKT